MPMNMRQEQRLQILLYDWPAAPESDEMANYIKKQRLPYPFVNSDEIMLKTIIRSSPGLMLIKKGIIMGKWSVRNLPTFS